MSFLLRGGRRARLGTVGLALWVLVALLMLAPIAAAQDGSADAQDPTFESLRGPAGEAPTREPRTLEVRPLAGDAVQTVLELPATADTFISSGRPDQNFATWALFLGYNQSAADPFQAERVLVRFEVLGNIPGGVKINSARLRLYMNSGSPANDGPMNTVLRRTASPWSEAGVTWNSEPDWGEVRSSASVGAASGWYEWNVTDLVAGWLEGSFPNDGMEIIGDEHVQQRERAFTSRETPTDLYPRLVVDYTVFSDTQPPIVTVNPLAPYVARNFIVSWSGTDQGTSGIAYYDVEYRVDRGPWQAWLSHITYTTDEFVGAQDGRLYEFRARGVDQAGNVEPFDGPEASTTADYRPPTSTVLPLPAVTNSASFQVSWTGSDAGSGVQYFDLRYRFNGGAWIDWQQQTSATSATFTAMEDGLYEFEVRAVDNIGLVESFAGRPEAETAVDAQPPFMQPQRWLPLVFK